LLFAHSIISVVLLYLLRLPPTPTLFPTRRSSDLLGSPDTWRDVRGFAMKFYTQEGNFDLVGNNTPIFFVRDPMKKIGVLLPTRRSEEHTSELQSRFDLVCRLLLEKKKKNKTTKT